MAGAKTADKASDLKVSFCNQLFFLCGINSKVYGADRRTYLKGKQSGKRLSERRYLRRRNAKWRRLFPTRQNICAMREQRQRFSCTASLKSTAYAHSVGKADDRTENNGRLASLFLFLRQTKAVMKISLLHLTPLLFCVRTISDKKALLGTFGKDKSTSAKR